MNPGTVIRSLLAALMILAGCAIAPITPEAPATVAGGKPPPAVEYDLGEATIIQERFPQDSRFRNMPVRLNGVIAAPEKGGPYPVVLILHGTHPGCPVDEMGVDRWPCDPQLEQRNYRGFAYLVSELAAQGYVALSININGENSFGFGEPSPGERLRQLVDLHLGALAQATSGGENAFGVELTGRADMDRLAIFGHSRGGEAAIELARASAAGDLSFGPVNALYLIAPAVVFVDPAAGAPAPMAILLSACDGDVIDQNGQMFYEALRLQDQHDWATSVWLERANHNHFNTLLPPDAFSPTGRSDCTPLLDADVQRAFLVKHAGDFLAAVFTPDQTQEAVERMGVQVTAPALGQLYGQAAQAALLPPAERRLSLLTPTSADELATGAPGGAVTAEGVATMYCPPGYYTPTSHPELAPCRRAQVVVPGQPAHAIVSWETPGSALRFDLPAAAQNLLPFDAVSVRGGVDPLSPLNAADASQRFSVQLTDRAGNVALAPVRPDEPALRYPEGEQQEDDSFGGDFPLFSGRLPLMPVRIPLSAFAGVNLAEISQIALVFDQTDSGSLFLADVELVVNDGR